MIYSNKLTLLRLKLLNVQPPISLSPFTAMELMPKGTFKGNVKIWLPPERKDVQSKIRNVELETENCIVREIMAHFK